MNALVAEQQRVASLSAEDKSLLTELIEGIMTRLDAGDSIEKIAAMSKLPPKVVADLAKAAGR